MPMFSRSLSHQFSNSGRPPVSDARRRAGSIRSSASASQVSTIPMAVLTPTLCRCAYDHASASGSTVSSQ